MAMFGLFACAVQPGLLESPAPSPSPTSAAAIWERSGGIAGICRRLTIQLNGAYTLFDCGANREMGSGILSATEMERLNALLSQYATHQYQVIPPDGSADMFTDLYTLYGHGDAEPSALGQAGINEHLAGLAAGLEPAPAGENPGAASGIEGRVWLGPTCPGPTRQDAPDCTDKPFQAEITVLELEGGPVAATKSDRSGNFKVSLPPGDYILRPESPAGSRLPRAGEHKVTVFEDLYTWVEIRYDTGIR
jgi:hypothetical protein